MTAHQKYGENNYPKAVAISTGIMVVFLLLSYFLIVNRAAPLEEVGTGGIIVNYGTADEGMGTDYMSVEQPSMDPNANGKAPDKVVPNTDPQPTPTTENNDKDIVTQNTEDAPEINTKESKPANNVSAVKLPEKDKAPTINPNALYKGSKNNASGQGDGTGSKPGNQGSENGDPLSPDYGEGGSGNGGVALDLKSRRFVDIPHIDDNGQASGIIAVDIRVDKSGTIIYARAGARGTTISDLSLWRKCEQAVTGARLNQLESAPEVQVGVVKFRFKVK
ncbi:energy transducer TonB [Pedobacter sp. HMF7647]|uniref:Energy transducer TonB n=2 Tax=Hufsiella arboris TaxID=2695275 RepID=A0A7K1YB91_9SPHI|nr:energy transducer TonB [Hufsiella arboris]MXV51369.1 energy transducer TonB [Hufsiella arboris]